MKYTSWEPACMIQHVAPLVGAWIEIVISCPKGVLSAVAPLVGAWIEIYPCLSCALHLRNVAPLVGAWIEIESLSFFALVVLSLLL